jgi:hypothetical protein
VRSHPENVVPIDPIDDEEATIMTANHDPSGMIVHASVIAEDTSNVYKIYDLQRRFDRLGPHRTPQSLQGAD